MWGKRKKKVAEQPESSLKEKAAFGIGKMINRMQSRFGNTLNRKTKNLSQRGKLVLLILVCIVFGGGSIYTMIDGASSSKSASRLLNTKTITVPKHIDRTGEDGKQVKVFLTQRDMQRIREFRRYMDSLKSSKQGVRIYDSIMKARPGLMDSLTQIEQLFGIDSSYKK